MNIILKKVLFILSYLGYIVNNKFMIEIKRVLGVHGMGSSINKDSWKNRIVEFHKKGIELELFQFNTKEDPTYESWEETYKTIDFSNYDAIYTSSFGGQATVKYLLDNNIKVKRLVMGVAGRSNNTISGKYKNTQIILDSFIGKDLSVIADEIIVISTKDDDVVPFESGRDLAKMCKGDFILLENGGHRLEGHLDLIIYVVKNGNTKKPA